MEITPGWNQEEIHTEHVESPNLGPSRDPGAVRWQHYLLHHHEVELHLLFSILTCVLSHRVICLKKYH